jgi:hypothetical protein
MWLMYIYSKEKKTNLIFKSVILKYESKWILSCDTFSSLCTSSFDSFCVHHDMQTPMWHVPCKYDNLSLMDNGFVTFPQFSFNGHFCLNR